MTAADAPASRPTAAVTADIDRHRTRLAETAAELRQRLRPEQLAHDASQVARAAVTRQAGRFERRAAGVVRDLGTDVRRWLPSHGSEATAAVGMAFSAWSARRRWTRWRRRRALVGSRRPPRWSIKAVALAGAAAACGAVVGWRWRGQPPPQPPTDPARSGR